MTTLELTLSNKVLTNLYGNGNTKPSEVSVSKRVNTILSNYFSYAGELSPVFSSPKDAIAYAKAEVKKYRASMK